MNKKNIIYPLLALLLLISFTLLLSSGSGAYIDLTSRYETSYFVDDYKVYLGYANYVKEVDIKKGKIVKRYNIFDEETAYQIYSKSLLIHDNNIFFRTYAKADDNSIQEGEEYLFWYDIKNKKLVKKVETGGPTNIVKLKDKDFILCGNKLIRLSSKKVYQITSLSLDEKKNIRDAEEKSSEKNTLFKAQWSKWFVLPDGRCYTLLTVYSSKGKNNSLISTKLYQYNFLDSTYKRKELSNYGSPFSLDERSNLLNFIGNNKLYIADFDKISCNINIYDVHKEKIEKKIDVDFSKTWGIMAFDNSRYLCYLNIEYSDDGINYSDCPGLKNSYQKINILVIDIHEQKVVKKMSEIFFNEPFNRISFLGLNKGALYIIQDFGLGNEKKIIALDIWKKYKPIEKTLDIKFIPQMMTEKKFIVGFEEGNIDDVKIVKLNF